MQLTFKTFTTFSGDPGKDPEVIREETHDAGQQACNHAVLLKQNVHSGHGSEWTEILVDGKIVAILSGSFPAMGYVPVVQPHTAKKYSGHTVGEPLKLPPEVEASVNEVILVYNNA